MPNRREGLGLLAMCAIFVVLSVAGLAAAFITRLVTSIDGLLLIVICLMMGGLFSLALFGVAKEEGFLPQRKAKEEHTAPARSDSAKPEEGK